MKIQKQVKLKMFLLLTFSDPEQQTTFYANI